MVDSSCVVQSIPGFTFHYFRRSQKHHCNGWYLFVRNGYTYCSCESDIYFSSTAISGWCVSHCLHLIRFRSTVNGLHQAMYMSLVFLSRYMLTMYQCCKLYIQFKSHDVQFLSTLSLDVNWMTLRMERPWCFLKFVGNALQERFFTWKKY